MASKQKKQYRLFDEEFNKNQTTTGEKTEGPVKLNALKLSKNDNKKESKLKKLISYRIKRIEKLNSLFEDDKASLRKIKNLYHKNLSDDLIDLCNALEDYNENLVKRYGQKSFPIYLRDVMEYLIEENFDELHKNNHITDNVKDLINAYNELKNEYYGFDDEDFEGWSDSEEEYHSWNNFFDIDDDDEYDDDEDAFEKEFADQFAKQFIMQMLKDLGMEVNEDFFEGLDPSDPDFQTKFEERLFEYKEHQENTAKAQETRQKVLSTDKEFTKLYKSLVKKIHPDLTTDDTERERREVLMKELSSVWEERDYYQLLLLQAKIDPEFNGGMDLNKNHLQQIADDLFEKMKEIEHKRYRYKNSSENEFYFGEFFARSDKGILSKIEKHKTDLEHKKREICRNINRLKTQKSAKVFFKELT